MSLSSLLADLGVTRFTSIHHWDAHPFVGWSSLCFAVPAMSYAAVAGAIWETNNRKVDPTHLALYTLLAALFALVVVTCYLADYCFIKRGHRSAFGRFDIRVASLTFLLCVLDFSLRAPIIETVALTALTIVAFLYSGLSASFDEWVFRHCLWHGLAGSIGTYAAWRCRPGGPSDAACLWIFLWMFVGFSICLTSASLVFWALGPERRRSSWLMGAAHAHWTSPEGGPQADSLLERGQVPDDLAPAKGSSPI